MASQKANGPRRRPRGAEGGTESERATAAGRDDAAQRAARAKRDPAAEDWADEAARARTSSDPRRVAPHDAAGVPSTGDSR